METRKRGASGSRDVWGARVRVLWCCMCAVVDGCGCATRVSLCETVRVSRVVCRCMYVYSTRVQWLSACG